MSKVGEQVGGQIRTIRKKKKMTLEELAQAIHKSRSAVSKYEKGEIALDIETLYEIAEALRVPAEQLLYRRPEAVSADLSSRRREFFQGASRFYSYLYDGRNNELLRCLFEILPEWEERRPRVIMYMNFQDYHRYQSCENTYLGYIEHYDAITNIQMTNQHMPMEKASVQILASSLDSDTKWGLFNGFSSRPMMPIAAKMLFSRERVAEGPELLRQLKISKTDIRLLKLYNMFAVI